MKYIYTWNHLKLFAEMCCQRDDKDNITQNWVDILEEHHSSTYPFTLWPLTFKQSAILASPSLVSPKFVDIRNSTVNLKIYASNDILVICFQKSNYQDQDHDHKKLIGRVKKNIMISLMSHRGDRTNMDLTSIIFVGYGENATLAILMSLDIGRELKKEADFMEDGDVICVDCITFSAPSLHEDIWANFIDVVDKNINVVHVKDYRPRFPMTSVVVGAYSDLGKNKVHSTPSLKKILSIKKSQKIEMSAYIDAIQTKIII